MRPRVFAGEAEASGLAAGLGDVSALLRPLVFAGEAEASGLAIGDGDVSAFLRPRVFAGDAEASGLVAGAGEVSAFLRPRFFAGEAEASGLALGDGAGLCASPRETQAKMVISKSRARFVVMERRLEVRREFRQRQCETNQLNEVAADADDLVFSSKAATRPTQRKPVISINI